MQGGLKKFGNVAPRQFQQASVASRGIGVRPDGGVTLAIFDKEISQHLLSDRLRPDQIGATQIGSVTLSAADWSALAPPEPRAGTRWTVPESVGRQFWPLLSPSDAKFSRPDEVDDVQFMGRVTDVRDGAAYIAYGGRISGLHNGDGRGWKGHELFTKMKLVSGVGIFDSRSGQMLALTWVFDGVYSNYYRPPYHGQPIRYGWVLEWRRGSKSQAAAVQTTAPTSEAEAQTDDSTPERALQTFLLALAAGDEPTLRAVSLPHAQIGRLLGGPRATPEQLAQLKARLEEKPIRRLKEGDPVTMPNGESRVIRPDDVRGGRVVLWPDGAPLPTRLENVGGHWKVFAGTYIATQR